MWSLRTSTLVALVVSAASYHGVTEGQLIDPVHPSTHYLRRATVEDDLSALIQSYYDGSGFPKAGRTLQQKIDEADTFLAEQLPKTGAVGVATAVVYQDQVALTKGYGVRRFTDSTSSVTKDDLFQIGSVSKTFIALGVGLLVDDGKIQWTDPVKKHLPWLKLFDKYAEEHVRIGDLLSMNSGLGRQPDLAIFAGAYDSPRKLVEALEYMEPEFSLRETPAYANVNFELLGQLIEEVSGKSWPVFLKERIWEPLGMSHTFAGVQDVPADLQATKLNAGHVVCEMNVRGPYNLVDEPFTEISPGYKYLASGSIVSSAVDMAKLQRIMLNKGTVDDVKLFQSPEVISEMITGKNVAINDVMAQSTALDILGIHFSPDGDSLSAGYGFDMVGKLTWGHAYFFKGGDTYMHHTTTGYAPVDGLGVVMLSNSEDVVVTLLDHLSSYVMGIFLDVPKPVLDWQFQKWRGLVKPMEANIPGAPACGFPYWENPPHLPVSPTEAKALVGEYAATVSTTFFPRAVIGATKEPNEFTLRLGAMTASLFFVGDYASSKIFMSAGNSSYAFLAFRVIPDSGDHNGSFVLDFGGIDYRKQ